MHDFVLQDHEKPHSLVYKGANSATSSVTLSTTTTRILLGEQGQTRARTEKFQSSFYPNCTYEGKKLDPEIKIAPSIAVLKSKPLPIIHTPAKSVFGIHDLIGLSFLSQKRVILSK